MFLRVYNSWIRMLALLTFAKGACLRESGSTEFTSRSGSKCQRSLFQQVSVIHKNPVSTFQTSLPDFELIPLSLLKTKLGRTSYTKLLHSLLLYQYPDCSSAQTSKGLLGRSLHHCTRLVP
jgi:hypothetical protein